MRLNIPVRFTKHNLFSVVDHVSSRTDCVCVLIVNCIFPSDFYSLRTHTYTVVVLWSVFIIECF